MMINSLTNSTAVLEMFIWRLQILLLIINESSKCEASEWLRNFYTHTRVVFLCPVLKNLRQTRYVAMPSPMAALWVSQNSDPVYRRLWTVVHQIKFACAEVSVVLDTVFWLTMSCCIPEIFAIKSRSCAKSHRNFYFFGPPNFVWKGPPEFLTEFYKSSSPSNMWQSLVTMGQAALEIRRWEKEINDGQNRIAGGQHRWRATVTSYQSFR